MIVTDSEVTVAHDKYRKSCGGDRNDYFALVYLSKHFQIKQDDLIANVAFGNYDYGVDAYYLDGRSLFLYQFKWSVDPSLFVASYDRLITAGMERIFGNPLGDPKVNNFIVQLRTAMEDARPKIEQVILYFVFTGDIDRAENSRVLSNKQEDLVAKQQLVEEYFGRGVPRGGPANLDTKSGSDKWNSASYAA